MSGSREKPLSPKLAIRFAMKIFLLTAADGHQVTQNRIVMEFESYWLHLLCYLKLDNYKIDYPSGRWAINGRADNRRPVNTR